MSHTKPIFDSIAGVYDYLNQVLSLGLSHYWREKAVDWLRLLPGDRVLDLCCGTGDFASEVYSRTCPEKVHGVDVSGEMLAICQQKYDYVEVVQSDVLDLPYESAQFDAATLAFGPRNIPDLQRLWSEVQRVLRPGGELLILELTRPEHPPMSWLHAFYVHYLVPFVGRLLSGNSEAYAYLSDSVQGFMTKQELIESLRQGGFVHVQAKPLTFGAVTAFYAIRGS